MASENADEHWGIKNMYLMVLICQSVSISATATIPRTALESGSLGYMVSYVSCITLLGFPLLYMELIIGQFTGFNSFEVWQVRSCLSHIGHVIIVWQLTVLIYNYAITAVVIRYLILSLGHTPSYARCGPWAKPSCGITTRNFTVSQDCILSGPKYAYCEFLYTTYPEVQFYRNMMGHEVTGLHVDWRLCLPSAMLSIVLFFSSFMRQRSMYWSVGIMTVVPSIGFVLVFIGSMMQKGVVMYFPEAIDASAEKISDKLILTPLMNMMVYSLTVGTGMIVDAGSNCSFRAPCYANSVLTIAANIGFHILAVCTTAMMVCPFAYEHNLSTTRVMTAPLNILFERIPTWLREYDYNTFWLVLIFSCYACCSARKVVIIFNNLLQTLSKRFPITSKYFIVVVFCAVIILFLITLPFLGNVLLHFMGRLFRRSIQLISMFIVIIEWFVFIIWYGCDRFCEDVHFMQGFRPGAYVKFAWIVSGAFLLLFFIFEILGIVESSESVGSVYGLCFLGFLMGYIVGIAVVKVAVAACRRQARAALRLSAVWRPRSELLQRSRAMFTAQAMTKEYLYRQYHLQAGILARQRRADRTRVITLI